MMDPLLWDLKDRSTSKNLTSQYFFRLLIFKGKLCFETLPKLIGVPRPFMKFYKFLFP